MLAQNNYGKSGIRLVKVHRRGENHDLSDLTVSVRFEGDFAAAHVEGDNADVLPTDTMKNTVYALAAEHLTGAIETFGTTLAAHFLAFGQVRRARVDLREHGWTPIAGAGGTARGAFRRASDATRTACVSATREATVVESGLEDLVLMKTAGSAFSDFARDPYTTLTETRDRVMATRMTATWRHDSPVSDWDASHEAISATLLEVFADHESESVQHSIWVMAQAMLERNAGIEEVRMTLPNLHHLPVDLVPLGGTNRGEIFVATTEPYGLIEATVRRPAS